MSVAAATPVVRRARPALGTLVELGAAARPEEAARLAPAFDRAWAAVARVERALSAFDPASDVGRFNAAGAGAALAVRPDTAAVLRLAAALAQASGGLFDPTLGTGPDGWALTGRGGAARLEKRAAAVRLDLGGIAKGHAVDRALRALAAGLAVLGLPGRCWVNAGGDLRVRGVALTVALRDEAAGGARPWLRLSEGALATSDFGPGARARLLGGAAPGAAHVSVAAPRCAPCDALTKVVARAGRVDLPLLARYGATAWIHA